MNDIFESDAIYVIAIILGIIAFGVKLLEHIKESSAKYKNTEKELPRHSVSAAAGEANTLPALLRKCPSCGATIGVQDGFCKYCGSSQRVVKESNYSYSEHVERRIDEAQIKEIELKKEELKHAKTWWQEVLSDVLRPVGALFFIFLLIFVIVLVARAL